MVAQRSPKPFVWVQILALVQMYKNIANFGDIFIDKKILIIIRTKT